MRRHCTMTAIEGLCIVICLTSGFYKAGIVADAFALNFLSRPLMTGVHPHIKGQSSDDVIVLDVKNQQQMAPSFQPSASAYSQYLSNLQIPHSYSSNFAYRPTSGVLSFSGNSPVVVGQPMKSDGPVGYGQQIDSLTSSNILKEAQTIVEHKLHAVEQAEAKHGEQAEAKHEEHEHKLSAAEEEEAKKKEMEDEAKLLEEIKAVILSHYGNKDVNITIETHLEKDLDLDSLSKMEILLDIEKDHGVEIPEEKAATAETVGHVYDEVRKMKFNSSDASKPEN